MRKRAGRRSGAGAGGTASSTASAWPRRRESPLIQRGQRLGRRAAPLLALLRRGPGLLVRDVIPNGPADREQSKLKAGDVIVSIDGKAVDPAMDITTVLNGPLDRDILLHIERAIKGEGDKEEKKESTIFGDLPPPLEDCNQLSQDVKIIGFKFSQIKKQTLWMIDFFSGKTTDVFI